MPGDDAPWRKIYHGILEATKLRCRVGILAEKGGNASHGKLSLIELAATHEFGSSDGHVPERSFIRSTFYVRVAKQLDEKLTAACKLVLAGVLDARKALNLLGAWGSAEVKNTITMHEADQYGPYPYPPLADSTIAAKGSSVPLIDTSQLKNAITWVVVES